MKQRIADIPLSGLSNSPNDLSCDDGNLAVAMGVVHEQSAILNVCHSSPKVIATLPEGSKVVYQHKGSNYSHFIVRQADGSYGWFGVDGIDKDAIVAIDGLADVNAVSSLGDTIVFYTGTGPMYYSWKDYSYVFIGSRMPEIDIRFGLVAHKYMASDNIDTFEKTFTLDKYDDDETVDNYYKLPSFRLSEHILDRSVVADDLASYSDGTFLDADLKAVNDCVIGEANKFTGGWCAEHGYFSQPFLVRAAYRLFDGTTTMDTPPVLMIPASQMNPMPCIMMIRKEGVYIDTIGIGCELKVYIADSMKSLIEPWKDIIKGIDIFVSAPIYTYDQGGQCKNFVAPKWELGTPHGKPLIKYAENAFSISGKGSANESLFELKRFYNENLSSYNGVMSVVDDPIGGHLILIDNIKSGIVCTTGNKRHTFISYYNIKENNSTANCFNPSSYIMLPYRKADDMLEEIKDCSNFYLAKSFNIDELPLGGSVIDMSNGRLTSIVSGERLVSEYDSHHSILPRGCVAYNNRLNIFDITKSYFEGFKAGVMLPVCNKNQSGYNNMESFVFIKKADGDSVVMAQDDYICNIDTPALYVYYPDPNAYKMVLFMGGRYYQEFTLREHKGLNGAVGCTSLAKVPSSSQWKYEDAASKYNDLIDKVAYGSPSVEMHNVVMTSEVDNLFNYKAKNVEQVGQGTIIAMVPQTIALSSGQFGQFPMACFTSNGVWALAVNNEGGWESKQPISRDVLTNASALLQLDQEVMFATRRGLMVMRGSSVEIVSEVFEGTADTLIVSYRQYLNNAIGTYCGFKPIQTPNVPFGSFITDRNVSMHYDYAHQRVIISSSAYPYSFVFNKKDRLWTNIPICLDGHVNSYPECYANARHGSSVFLVDLSSDGDPSDLGIPSRGFIVTRPLKLDGSAMMKTLTSIIVKGAVHWTHTDLILYVSNDMSTWKVARTSRGGRMLNIFTTFRFFRVGIVTRLEKNECIEGLSIAYETRGELDNI